MSHPADEKTRQYLLQLMEESPDELVWLVKRLTQHAVETQYDLGRLAGIATKAKAIKDLWRQSADDIAMRNELKRWMRESPDELVMVVRSLMCHMIETQHSMGKLADLATRVQAIKELWTVLEFEINGKADATGNTEPEAPE